MWWRKKRIEWNKLLRPYNSKEIQTDICWVFHWTALGPAPLLRHSHYPFQYTPTPPLPHDNLKQKLFQKPENLFYANVSPETSAPYPISKFCIHRTPARSGFKLYFNSPNSSKDLFQTNPTSHPLSLPPTSRWQNNKCSVLLPLKRHKSHHQSQPWTKKEQWVISTSQTIELGGSELHVLQNV